jgi:hypothetical protein
MRADIYLLQIIIYVNPLNQNGHELTDSVTPWSRVLLEKPPVAQLLKNFSTFYEPESSLPCSKKPSTGPYAEPD